VIRADAKTSMVEGTVPLDRRPRAGLDGSTRRSRMDFPREERPIADRRDGVDTAPRSTSPRPGTPRPRSSPAADGAAPQPERSAPATIRILVGEDNLIAREGVVRVLGRANDLEVVGVRGDLPSLRAAVEELRPDVVLTDVRMPPSGTDEGIRLAGELRATHPEIGVVVLSQHADPLYALALFEQGPEGRAYLLKDRLADADELARAVRQVAAGGALVDPRLLEELLTYRKESADSMLARLTPRERETLALVAEGRSNRAIASALHVTERAVERHVNAIYGKLGLHEAKDVSRRVRAALVFLSERRD
jgi:DNA-binding NarL/FixJ family response regulator